MTINFDVKNARFIQITFKGKNWTNDNFVNGMKNIELLSPNEEYSQGVFAKLVSECENNDPHYCGVHITLSEFDFNSFHLIDSKKRILTFPSIPNWFQVELTKGTAIVHAVRMINIKIKSFKIVAIDDINKPLDSWYLLIDVKEKPINDDKKNIIYYMNHPSPPVRFIRVIQKEPAWDENKRLTILHFDIFGYYL